MVAGFVMVLAGGSDSPLAAAGSSEDVLRGSGLSFPHVQPGLGQGLELVGSLDLATTTAPFPADASHEYSWSLYGPVVHQVDSSPGVTERQLTFGFLELREDASRNLMYLPHPPNAAVPSSFHDGTILLLGEVTELRILDVFGIVTATATVRFVAGSALPELAALTTWTFDSAVSPHGPAVPPGYGAHWSVELSPVAPVGVQDSSWGSLKALYR
ncbi:MAG: hypothetical protein HKN12_00115 [Gemmatimonadetes bacterium]|nr:hypothetical protein [Gemmatimonadota bacterium]